MAVHPAWRRALPACLATLWCTLALFFITSCQGPTTLDVLSQPGPYRVNVRMDPPTLNPPQLGTLTFEVKDAGTGKPANLQIVDEALVHTVLVHSDLSYFQHSATARLVQGGASVQVYFPRTGTYHVYALYRPVNAEPQVFRLNITSGTPTHGARLVDDSDAPKVNGGVRFDMLKGADPIRAGQPVQLAFHVTERGRPVDYLWPLFGAAGHLWIVNESGDYFAHESGTSQARYAPAATPTTTSIGTPTPVPAPTLVPAIAGALRTITAQPVPTLAPVQQTAMASLFTTPEIIPSPAYGPDIVFTHTFPHAGMYKMWLEIKHRGEVIHTDFTVRVQQ